MDRREFMTTGVAGTLGLSASAADRPIPGLPSQDQIRSLFPRLGDETFVSAAAGTPLGTFAETGLRRYTEYLRHGPRNGRADYLREMLANIRGLYGGMIGAQPNEIALVHSTKAGEQIITDTLNPAAHGQNIVTNDLHFAGALHNLVGLQRAGTDVRIVKNQNWDVPAGAMEAAIDDRTALVAVTLVSNITGRIEPMRHLADIAHAHGAYVYADIIQAAGIMPFNVRDLGIDFAAANGYKWLYGVHGAGFLYVREELQGTALADRLFPGHVEYNYPPWVDAVDGDAEAFGFTPRSDASRYEPGHVNYLGYCGLYEGLKFIEGIGLEQALAHTLALNRRLDHLLDPAHYQRISPHPDQSPIITYAAADIDSLRQRLERARVVVSLVGGNRVRVSPGLYNNEADIDRLAEVMNA